MHLLVFCIVYPILWFISKLPWFLFYKLSDCIYFLMFHVIRYRRKIVEENISLAFPEKSKKEVTKISKASYKHICDIFLEMIKSLSIKRSEIVERFQITNIDLLKELEGKKSNIIAMMGHYNSYEWTNSIELISKFKCVGIYKPIKNKYFDRLAHKIRGRYGSRLLSSKVAFKAISEEQGKTDLNIYGLIADQSPKLANARFWSDFMGIKVPSFTGSEILSKKLRLDVYYLHVVKVKRGFYKATLVPLPIEQEYETREQKKFAITLSFIKMLEDQIREHPENYLWTHKRWKYKDVPIPDGATVI